MPTHIKSCDNSYDGTIVLSNYIWDGTEDHENHTIHYFSCALARETNMSVLFVVFVPIAFALKWPKFAWRYRPGLRAAYQENVRILYIWSREWRRATAEGKSIPVKRCVRKITAALKKMSITKPCVIFSEPAHFPLADALDCHPCIWYATDDFASGDNIYAESIRSNISHILEDADMAAVVSPLLHEKYSDHLPTLFLPNAVDSDEFHHSAHSVTHVHGWNTECSRPRIVYVGMLNHRIAYKELYSAITFHSDKSFIFIGQETHPLDEEDKKYIKALRELPHTQFLGYLWRHDMAWVLARCDIGIVPYRVDNFNSGCSPLKIYEYAASGLAVISTPLPATEIHKEDIYIASPEDFTTAITIVSEKCDSYKNRASAFAERNTWRTRIEEFTRFTQKSLMNSCNS